MKRHEWKFEYTARNLAEAAKSQVNKHAAKLEWWTKKKEEIVKNIPATAIEVHDSVASGYSHTKGFADPSIVIDTGIQRDLSECQQKIRLHHEMVEDYTGWVQVLEANPEARLQLEHDDFLHFFGK